MMAKCIKSKMLFVVGASLKIIQLLQHFEHLVSPLASAVHVCVEEYNHRSIVAELMR